MNRQVAQREAKVDKLINLLAYIRFSFGFRFRFRFSLAPTYATQVLMELHFVRLCWLGLDCDSRNESERMRAFFNHSPSGVHVCFTSDFSEAKGRVTKARVLVGVCVRATRLASDGKACKSRRIAVIKGFRLSHKSALANLVRFGR